MLPTTTTGVPTTTRATTTGVARTPLPGHMSASDCSALIVAALLGAPRPSFAGTRNNPAMPFDADVGSASRGRCCPTCQHCFFFTCSCYRAHMPTTAAQHNDGHRSQTQRDALTPKPSLFASGCWRHCSRHHALAWRLLRHMCSYSARRGGGGGLLNSGS